MTIIDQQSRTGWKGIRRGPGCLALKIECRPAQGYHLVTSCMHAHAALSMQSFGEHGRELITPEVGLRLLELLGQLGAQIEQEDPSSPSSRHQLLRQTVFKVGTDSGHGAGVPVCCAASA